MPLGRELIGVPVRAPDAAESLGEVTDLCFDPQGGLAAIVVTPRKGLFRRERAVPVDRFIKVSGEEAVLASEKALDAPGNSDGGALRLRQGARVLVGRPLFDGRGQELGAVGDVALEEGTLRIWGFEVSDGALRDLLDGRAIVEAQGAALVEDGVVLTGLAHMNLGPEGEPTS